MASLRNVSCPEIARPAPPSVSSGYVHEAEQRFPEIRRTALGGFIAAPVHRAWLVRHGVDTGKGGQRLLARKAANVTNFRHELRTERLTYAVHFRHDKVFREPGGELVYLNVIGFHR